MDWTELLVSISTSSYNFISKWGYIGLFVVSFLGSASIFFPIPNFVFIFTFGAILHPFGVALVTAIGSTLGETTGYLLGLGGKKILDKKYKKKIKRINEMFNKYGSDLWIVILGATPLPDDIAGIFCGLIKYDFKRYFIATFIGKLILSLALAYAGYYSLNWVLDFLSPRLGL